MRNSKHVWFTLFIVVALLLVTAGPATARVVKTPFTGTEVWVEDLDPGTESFPGEGLYHIRGGVSRFEITTTDLRLSGEDRVTVNVNFKLVDAPVYVTGPMWGTFRITNAGGYWTGVWAGYRDKQGYSTIEFVGMGGGGYAGLKLRLHLERLNPDPTAVETVTGTILERGH